MIKLANTDKTFSQQGLGCMSMSDFYGTSIPIEAGIDLISMAYDAGVNMFDTADMYAYGRNEILVGKAISALKNRGADRNNIILASKCGIVRDENDVTKRGIDNSYDYVKASCAASLARLGKDVESIDLYYIHRIFRHGIKINETMEAMAELLAEGKIKAVGLCEVSAELIRKANNALLKYTDGKHQLAAIQTEYSLMTRLPERNGVLDTCRELDIAFIAYGPLSRALLTGDINNNLDSLKSDDFRRNLPRFQTSNIQYNLSIVQQIKKMAEQKQCTPAQLALAWLFAQPGVVPIPGTTKKKHLLSNIDAEKVILTEDEVKILNTLNEAKGFRYTEAAMKAFGFEEEMEAGD